MVARERRARRSGELAVLTVEVEGAGRPIENRVFPRAVVCVAFLEAYPTHPDLEVLRRQWAGIATLADDLRLLVEDKD